MNARVFLGAVSGAVLCGCAGQKVAMQRPESPPLVVQIEDIDSEGQDFRPVRFDDLGVLLPIQFKPSSKQAFDQLWPKGTATPPVVWILQGRSLIARAWIAGPSEGRDVSGNPSHGLVLRFASFEDAVAAADRLREDPWDAMDRHLADTRFWILPGSESSAGDVARSQPPASGLPRELPKLQGAR